MLPFEIHFAGFHHQHTSLYSLYSNTFVKFGYYGIKLQSQL